MVLTVLTPRSTERKLYNAIDELSPTAFYYSSEAKYIHGGFWTKKIEPDVIVDPNDLEEMILQEDEFMSKGDYQDDNIANHTED